MSKKTLQKSVRTYRIEPEIYDTLKEICALNDTYVSNFIADTIKTFLKLYPHTHAFTMQLCNLNDSHKIALFNVLTFFKNYSIYADEKEMTIFIFEESLLSSTVDTPEKVVEFFKAYDIDVVHHTFDYRVVFLN